MLTSVETDTGLAFVWGKLAGEKMIGNESCPRMLEYLFLEKYPFSFITLFGILCQ
jgi:hypothetical protein